MKFNHTVLVATLALVAGAAFAMPALGQEDAAPEPVTFQVKATNEGADFWFEFEGISGRNPTVPVEPGQEVTVEVTGETGGHNFHVTEPVNEQTETIPEGETRTLTFTVPADATEIGYQCDPHISLNMMGKFTTQSTGGDGTGTGTGSGDGGAESPGFGVAALVVGLGAALFLVRRK